MKTLKNSDFLIPFQQDEKTISFIVKGRKIYIDKVPCYLHKSYDNRKYWVVSHYESGLKICVSVAKDMAIEKAKAIVVSHIEEIEEKAKAAIIALGWVYPLNPLK